MRLGLTYDLQTDPSDRHQAEFDPPAVIDAVCRAVGALGHDVVRLGEARAVLAAPNRVREVELVLNLAEGTQGRCREAWVPTMLEGLAVPYVGSGPVTLCLGLDKVMCKRLAVASGILTPRWICVEDANRLPARLPMPYPIILKPRYEGSGSGISQESIVRDADALARRVGELLAEWQQPILVEEFIPFGELTVCVIGNDPPVAYPAIQRPIDPTSRLSCHVARTDRWEAPLELTDALDAQARQVAVTMFQALGCRDMARIDLRVDARGTIHFLEINPLPSFDPDGSFGLLAEHLGMGYAQLVGRIVDAARRRLDV